MPPATFALTRSKVCVPCDLRPLQHPARCVVCICAHPSPRWIPTDSTRVSVGADRDLQSRSVVIHTCSSHSFSSPTRMSVPHQYMLHIFVHIQLGSVKVKIIVKTKQKRLNIFRSVPSRRVPNVGENSALCISQRLQSKVQIKRERNRDLVFNYRLTKPQDNEECQRTLLPSPTVIPIKSVSFFLFTVLRKGTTLPASADDVLLSLEISSEDLVSIWQETNVWLLVHFCVLLICWSN